MQQETNKEPVPKVGRGIRATERIAVPQRGAALGNFGVAAISDRETWVTAAEEMAGWLKSKRGPADGSVFVARILWPRSSSLPESTQIVKPLP